MNMENALAYLYAIGRGNQKNSLKSVYRLCELAGNPQNELKIIHVAGTNGKGSVVAFLSHTLMLAGYHTGRFTSPYVEVFNDRISIDEHYISDEDLSSYIEKLKPAVEMMRHEGDLPSWFAVLMVIAFCYFKDKNCDVVVLETGIGGLYDSTNVVIPILSVITSIGYDHMKELGNTIEKITYQKCGIIKKGIPVVASHQKEKVEAMIAKSSAKKGSALFVPSLPKDVRLTEDGNFFQIEGFDKPFHTALGGAYQVENAMTAICALNVLSKMGFSINQEILYRGIEHTFWIGRFQKLSHQPLVIADGAHNLAGMKAFCCSIDTVYSRRRKIFILGMAADKDYLPCIKRACKSADQVLAVTIHNPRALLSDELCQKASYYHKNVKDVKTAENALKIALSQCGKDDMICLCGSLFLVAEVISLWKKRNEEV